MSNTIEETPLEELSIDDIIDYIGEENLIEHIFERNHRHYRHDHKDVCLNRIAPDECIEFYGPDVILNTIGSDTILHEFWDDFRDKIDEHDLIMECVGRIKKSTDNNRFNTSILSSIISYLTDYELVQHIPYPRYFVSFFEHGNINEYDLLSDITPSLNTVLDKNSPFFNDHSRMTRILYMIRWFQDCLIEYEDIDSCKYKLVNYTLEFCGDANVNHKYIYDFLKSYISIIKTVKIFTNESRDIVEDILSELRLGILEEYNEHSKNPQIRKCLTDTFKAKEELTDLLNNLEKDLFMDLE